MTIRTLGSSSITSTRGGCARSMEQSRRCKPCQRPKRACPEPLARPRAPGHGKNRHQGNRAMAPWAVRFAGSSSSSARVCEPPLAPTPGSR